MAIITGRMGELTIGTKNISFDKAIEKAVVTEQHRRRISIEDPARNIRLVRDGDSLALSFRKGRRFETCNIRQSAFGQLCQHIGIRSGFMDDCISYGIPDTAVKAYSDYAKRERATGRKNIPTDLDLLIHGDEIAGVVTPNYKDDFKNSELLMMARDIEGFVPNFMYQTDDKVHIRFINETPMNVPDEKLFPGFTVGNSTVGLGALAACFYVYRFVCKNGLVRKSAGGQLFWQTHMQTENIAAFAASLGRIDQVVAITEKDIIAARDDVFEGKSLQKYLDLLKRRLAVEEIRDVKRHLTGLVNVTDDDILALPETSRWDVINAVTYMAHEDTPKGARSFDGRLGMETNAGYLLAG